MTLILNSDEIVNETRNCHLSLLDKEFFPTLKISIISLTISIISLIPIISLMLRPEI